MNKNPVSDPPFMTWLTNNKWASILFLPLRVWLGIQWITASEHKLTSAAWMVTGDALKGFWTSAVALTNGKGPIVFDWYRAFLQFLLNAQAYTWFAKLVAFGELTVGIALVIGAFTGFAALFGGLMNFNFMMAGSASTNPVLFLFAVLIILGWKVAGYLGADFFLLPWLGTPWRRKPKE